ncbi:sigma-70 family RNA polymerase sigma factor [Roseibacillus persicicus]|uniref:RNA polymerase sigma-70 region 2 domain-containing protein n=1 Tax=Roseibacillus persicicus TaxID=454148 RepID=A0A918WIA1_9BACT|nr:sigma-70 family RNA polymerase sigma factor [Roseibacillus persicicus]MDQ8190789.1 sigma-70 family RNA polymerase sigma factor [Roseibacillus persicicus]GHC54032.1 hypothetical protein GCM10007100_20430 [Roseibacillus persicicus]
MESPLSAEQEEELVNLIAQQQPVLRVLIRAMVPGRADCEDILQETNLVLWRKRDSYEMGTNFNAWAGTIARFQVMAWRKRSQANRLQTFDDEVLERLVESTCERWGNLPDRRQALRKCMQGISEDNRSLIEHRYFTKSSLADFAKAQGQSFASVRKKLERLRASLRDCINRQLAQETD